jgi:hypothetical protein
MCVAGGMTVSYDGINTFHFGYGSNTYTASVITTRICNDIPTDVSAIYDASVLGYPDLPPDIVVDDWCAAIGTELFSYNFAWFIDYMTGTCDCFGGDKRIIGIFGLYIYIDVT